ncbi:hypothetical protein BVI1335_90016 [Burkholderia vietnamiensis]|nr:hypothetical protein BVI1335_90016 [Burkholderia vietnamiensis]
MWASSRSPRRSRSHRGSRWPSRDAYPSVKPISSFARRPDAVKRGGPVSAAERQLQAALAVHRAHRHEKGQPRDGRQAVERRALTVAARPRDPIGRHAACGALRRPPLCVRTSRGDAIGTPIGA